MLCSAENMFRARDLASLKMEQAVTACDKMSYYRDLSSKVALPNVSPDVFPLWSKSRQRPIVVQKWTQGPVRSPFASVRYSCISPGGPLPFPLLWQRHKHSS